MGKAENFSSISWRTMAPFGIEVELDLAAPLDEAGQQQLRDLLFQHNLVLLRGQKISIERQIEVMDWFAPVLRAPEGVNVLSNIRERGIMGTKPLAFHSDQAFSPYPCTFMSLCAIDVAGGETSTRFASGVLAYQRLPDVLKRELFAVEARMVFPLSYMENPLEGEVEPWRPHYNHPAVKLNPITKQPLLYVNELQTAGLDGVSPERSTELMKELFKYLYDPDCILEHRWHNGDMVIWDNIALQHARSVLSSDKPRTIQRVLCAEKRLMELFPDIPAEVIRRSVD